MRTNLVRIQVRTGQLTVEVNTGVNRLTRMKETRWTFCPPLQDAQQPYAREGNTVASEGNTSTRTGYHARIYFRPTGKQQVVTESHQQQARDDYATPLRARRSVGSTASVTVIRPLQVQPLQESFKYAGLVNVWLTGVTGRA